MNGAFLEGREVVDECDVDLGMRRPAGPTNQSPPDFMRKGVIYSSLGNTAPKTSVSQMAAQVRVPGD